jgi:hypothetical protein
MTAAAPPEGRYGPAPTPGRRRRTVIALAAVGAVGVAVTVWLGLNVASQPVTWRDVGFVVHGSSSVDVTFDVMRTDPSVPVQCQVQALNVHFAQVGVVVVDVAPGDLGSQRETAQVATSEEATTGVVHRCWVTGQD